MEKNLQRFLMLVACIFFCTASYAQTVHSSGTCGDNLTWTLYTTGELVISGTGTMTDYTSSSKAPWNSWYVSGIKSLTIETGVTSIGNYAFHSCSSIVSVNIPESVNSIGDFAFYGCSSIVSINIPESVYSIGKYSFQRCSSLTYINIPLLVTSIGAYTFGGCTSLASITIHEGITSIGGGAFSGCKSLTSIIIPKSVTSMGSSPFNDCSGLISLKVASGNSIYDSRQDCNAIIISKTNALIVGCKNTIIPENVTSIGTSAFQGCTGLTDIIIPKAVTSIDANAFLNCSSLTSILIPMGVTYIAVSAFEGCSSLTSIQVASGNTMYDSRQDCNAIIRTSTNTLQAGCMNTIIPNGITCIGSGAFKKCTGLTSIVIPESVTSIEFDAFFCCYSLTSIVIPKSVSKIGNSALYYCSSLTNIICHAITPPTCGSYVFMGVPSSTCVLMVPYESLTAYSNAENWKNFATITTIEEIKQCSTPIIAYSDGKIRLQCETEGATFYCTIVAADNVTDFFEVTSNEVSLSKKFVVTAYAVAEGYTQSESATLTITLSDGDVNGDGDINVSDVTKLVDVILHKGNE